MNSKRKQLVRLILLAGLVFIVLVGLTGCKKKSEPAGEAKPGTEAVAAAQIEQTTCPIMGQPINKNIFTEYEGKKVYFCCPGCEEKFKAEPEKYVAKLPQFKD